MGQPVMGQLGKRGQYRKTGQRGMGDLPAGMDRPGMGQPAGMDQPGMGQPAGMNHSAGMGQR